jgi:hypothetical protein
LIHCIYESDQSFRSFDFMVHTTVSFPHIVIQILLGSLTPILLACGHAGAAHDRSPSQSHLQHRQRPDADRHLRHALEGSDRRTALLQKLCRIHPYKMGFIAREGLVAIVLSILPFAILWRLMKLLPPWEGTHALDLSPVGLPVTTRQ